MKYLSKSFSSPPNSKAYVDNWDAVFGDKPAAEPVDEPVKCAVCGMWPDSGVHHLPKWGGGHDYACEL